MRNTGQDKHKMLGKVEEMGTVSAYSNIQTNGCSQDTTLQ